MNTMQPQMGTPQMSEEELRKLAQLIQQTPDMQKNIQGQKHELGYLTGTEMDAMETVRRDPGLTQSLAEQGKNLEPTFENGIRAFPGKSDYRGSGSGGSKDRSSSGTPTGSSGQGSDRGRRGGYGGGGAPTGASGAGSDRGRRGGYGGGGSRPRGPAGGPVPGSGAGSGGDGGAAARARAAEAERKRREAEAARKAKEEAERKKKMAAIEGQTLTSDTTFDRWHARNKDKHGGLSKEQMEQAYNIAATKSKEDATAQVPAMVEKMNSYMDAQGPAKTFDEFKASLGADVPANLSEATLRDMYENARTKKKRGDAFTLTPEEVEEFARDPIVTDEVMDAEAAKIGDFDLAEETEVGEVADVTPTEVDAIASVTDEDLDAIFAGGADKAEQLLLDRISGKATSPAEQQLKRTSEANMRMLMGMTAGGDADPAKMRQLKNQWADMTQFAVGEAADLRSQESLAAEKQLVELYKDKDTKVLNTKLANMEKDKQLAIKNGDLSLAGKLANQQTMLTKVVTQANLNQNTKLANLEAMKQKMIEQGKMDMATNLANMQKNVVLAETDAKLAVQGRAMDDGLAMANFQGQKELYGLEAELDMDQAKNDLTEMGFDLQRDLAELDAATQREVAQLTAQWRRAQGDTDKQSAIIGAVGTVIAGFAASDIRAKTNISSGAGEVEAFLDALNEYKYEYKDPEGDQAGMFVGVMAQDLEKTPMGASFVKDTPSGKMVDYGHGLAAILASQANIHDRLRHLEEG